MKPESENLLNRIFESGSYSEEDKQKIKKCMENLENDIEKASTTERMKTGSYAVISSLFLKDAKDVPYEMKNDILMNVIDMLCWGIRAETLALILNKEIEKDDTENMVALYEYAGNKSNKYREYVHNMITNLSEDLIKKRMKEREQVH